MKRAWLCAQRSGSSLIAEFWCGQKIFKQSMKRQKAKNYWIGAKKKQKTNYGV